MTRTNSDPNQTVRIQALIGDLGKLLRRLNGERHTKASGDVSEFVSGALTRIVDGLRQSADATGKAFKAGGVYKKTGEEIERHPLATLAIAAGIGFLLGSANSQ